LRTLLRDKKYTHDTL